MFPVIDRRGLKFQNNRRILYHDDAVDFIQIEHSFFDYTVRNQKCYAQDERFGMDTNISKVSVRHGRFNFAERF